MKLDNQKSVVTVNGSGKSTEMKMKVDGKAFTMMSSGLYKNKIGSIVREICSNAKDAHGQANNTEPFKIHLPTKIEPWFSVRDYGSGLTYTEMVEIYCVLFTSTKDQSNDSLGAFGLGSKTPFAYSDSFTVTSIKNGIETHYSVAKNDDGIPELHVMAENETDKHSGLTVTLAVNSEDFSEFSSETKTQLQYFSQKPTIVGVPYFSWNSDIEPVFTINNTMFRSYENWGSSITIIQGEVGYKLDLNYMKAKISDDEYENLCTLKTFNCILTFNIGEIGVTLSREGIEYDTPTIANIMREVKIACDGIPAQINSHLDSHNTDWDKACVLNDNSTYRHLAIHVGYKINNMDVDGYGCSTFSARDLFNTETTLKELDRWGNARVVTTQNIKLKKYHITRNTGRLSAFASHSPHTIKVDSSVTTLFIRDTNKQPLVKVKKYVEDNGLNEQTVYIIETGVDNFDSPETYFTDAKIAEISKAFGELPTVKVSGLSVPVRGTTYREPRTTARFLSADTARRKTSYYQSNFDRHCTKEWSALTTPLKDMDGGVYIQTSNCNVNYYDCERLNEYEKLVNARVTDTPIYAFNPSTAKRASKLDEWVTLEAYLKKMQTKTNEIMQKCKTITRYSFISNLCNDYFNTALIKKLNKYIGLIENKTAIKFIRDTASAKDKFTRKYDSLDRDLRCFYDKYEDELNSKFNEEFSNHADAKTIINASDDFRLLQYVSNGDVSDDEILHIIQYVNCMGEGA